MIRLVLICVSFFLFLSNAFSLDNRWELDIALQKNLERVEATLEGKNLYRKVYVYTNLKEYIDSYMKSNDLSLEKTYILEKAVSEIDIVLFELDNMIEKTKRFTAHNTLSIVFSNNNIEAKIREYSEKIKSTQSIFIFRDSANLSRENMKLAVFRIRELNDDTFIFTDQEWGQVIRYHDFDLSYTRDSILDDPYIQLRKSLLSKSEFENFLALFPTWNTYFPSLYQVGSLYDSYTPESAKIMLEMFAYMRLESHKVLWINTYGLVADLSRGNPSITPLGRSFSKHISKYEVFLEAFAKASRETWVLVYLKHFPWVGVWSVDSHNGILDLRNSEEELSENMEVFAYAQGVFWEQPLWAMVWHVIVPDSLKGRFNEIAWDFDFLISDDLGMQGYLQATGKNFNSWFFSTDVLKDSSNFFTLDRGAWFYVR